MVIDDDVEPVPECLHIPHMLHRTDQAAGTAQFAADDLHHLPFHLHPDVLGSVGHHDTTAVHESDAAATLRLVEIGRAHDDRDIRLQEARQNLPKISP